MNEIPSALREALVHVDESWAPILEGALQAVMQSQPTYLGALCESEFLPTQGRIFRAFSLPRERVRYVLIGEGPYPRPDSATGYAFMDGAVGQLWSTAGLSTAVNRATSLRNFIKMLLVAEGLLEEQETGGAAVARATANVMGASSSFIQTLTELQDNFTERGFLLLNASLVFRKEVAPIKDAKAWLPFLVTVLQKLSQQPEPPQLILWGKIAGVVSLIPSADSFAKVVAEHPYNLSFIRNKSMQEFFGPMHLLCRKI